MKKTFFLDPYLLNREVIDYYLPYGSKIYHNSIQRIKNKSLFDCQAMGIKTFLTQLKAISQIMGWMDILIIPEDETDLESEKKYLKKDMER